MTGKESKERRKLREEILATLDAAEIDPQRQKTAVMTRLDNSLVEFLDALGSMSPHLELSDGPLVLVSVDLILNVVEVRPDFLDWVHSQHRESGDATSVEDASPL